MNQNINRYIGYGVIAVIMIVVFRLVMPKMNGSFAVWLAAIFFAAIIAYVFELNYRAKKK
jgi:uncharacterized membrane protein YccC